MAVDGAVAEEAPEAVTGDVGVFFVVHVALVVVEEGELLFGEIVRFESDGEGVGGLDVGFQILGFGFVESADEVEGVVLFLLLSGTRGQVSKTIDGRMRSYSFVFGNFLTTSLV